MSTPLSKSAAFAVGSMPNGYVGKPGPSQAVLDYVYSSKDIHPEFWDEFKLWNLSGVPIIELIYAGIESRPGGVTFTPDGKPNQLLNPDLFNQWVLRVNNVITGNSLISITPEILEKKGVAVPADISDGYREAELGNADPLSVSWINRKILDFSAAGTLEPLTVSSPSSIPIPPVAYNTNVVFIRRIEIDVVERTTRWVWGAGYRRNEGEIPPSLATHVVENNLVEWAGGDDPDGASAFQKLVAIGNAIRIAKNWP